MKYSSYVEFDREGEKIFNSKGMEGLLAHFDAAGEVLPEDIYKKYYFIISSTRAILYYRVDRHEEFYNIIKSLTDEGYACGAFALRRFPENDERYRVLAERIKELTKKEEEKAGLEFEVHLPEGYDESEKYPVFFALHGDGMDGNIEDLKAYWKPDTLVNQGFILVYVKSSQVYCYNGRQWNKDIETARRDISQCLSEVSGKYSIDSSRILIGGFSGGAMASVDIAMSRAIGIKGFISLCPGKIPSSFTRENALKSLEQGIKGVIFEGELDLEPSVQDVVKVFDEISYPYQYILNKDCGHAFPDDFDEKLEKAVKFILG